jgi:hypothetical protein
VGGEEPPVRESLAARKARLAREQAEERAEQKDEKGGAE